MLRILDHPFLVTMFGALQSDTHVYFLMECCEGGDMHSRLGSRSLPEAAAITYAAEILLALQYLHLQGVIYRDLKPENVLLHPSGHIRLTDFDLACCSETSTIRVAEVVLDRAGSQPCDEPTDTGNCSGTSSSLALPPTTKLSSLMVEPVTRSNSFVGTEEYLAPETIAGTGHAAAVDWWALGIFIFEMLTGRTPFQGAHRNGTFENILHSEIVWPVEGCNASSEARDIVARLLHKVRWQLLIA